MKMDEKIEVVPKGVISYVRIHVDNFKLNACDMWCTCYMFCDNSRMVEVQRVYVPPHVYSEWATDDDTIILYVLDEVGLEPLKKGCVHFPE